MCLVRALCSLRALRTLRTELHSAHNAAAASAQCATLNSYSCSSFVVITGNRTHKLSGFSRRNNTHSHSHTHLTLFLYLSLSLSLKSAVNFVNHSLSCSQLSIAFISSSSSFVYKKTARKNALDTVFCPMENKQKLADRSKGEKKCDFKCCCCYLLHANNVKISLFSFCFYNQNHSHTAFDSTKLFSPNNNNNI